MKYRVRTAWIGETGVLYCRSSDREKFQEKIPAGEQASTFPTQIAKRRETPGPCYGSIAGVLADGLCW